MLFFLFLQSYLSGSLRKRKKTKPVIINPLTRQRPSFETKNQPSEELDPIEFVGNTIVGTLPC
jgi:hypothetical protein